MIITVKFSMNNTEYTLSIDEKDDYDALHKAIVLGNPPSYCPLIKGGKVKLQTNKDTEGNTYINAVCAGEINGKLRFAKSKLGRYKTGGYFWNTWAFDEFAEKRANADDPDKVIQRDVDEM